MKKTFISSTVALVVLFVFASGTVFAHKETAPVEKMEPVAGETHHLEVKPESIQGYRLPYMKVTAIIIEQDSKKSSTVEFHPMFGGNFHYGANVALEPKQYLIRFHLDQPSFAREDQRENQWLTPLEAEFVFDGAAKFEKSIKIGQKDTSDMKVSFETEHAEEMFVLASAKEEHLMMNETKPAAPPIAAQGFQGTAAIIVALAIGLILGFAVSRFWKFTR